MDDSAHECDLFLLSSHRAYSADRALPEFARRGLDNIHGWGLGYYQDGEGKVLRTAEPALDPTNFDVSREFALASQAVSSPIILGHLRLRSRGPVRPENNHPFKLTYLGYDWLLIHNGTAKRPDTLVPEDRRILSESSCDSARVAEFLSYEIQQYMDGQPAHSLIHAVRHAFAQLLERDSGKFNLILSNGHLSFALIHWRTFYLLRRAKGTGDTALLSTLELTNDEAWFRIEPVGSNKAKMLAFSGPTLVYNGDL
jgi:predicted glutamine amidotransferase